MPDERVVERYFERAADMLTEQTRQLSRLAYAMEQQVIITASSTAPAFAKPCIACGCRLLTQHHDECPACRTPTGRHA